MSAVWQFCVKFASLITATLHCFDRVLFKGYLPLASPIELEHFVDRVLRVRRHEFATVHAPAYAARLVAHAQDAARKAGRTYAYRTGSFRKDEWARQLLREQRIDRGLIGILCTQETCPSFQLVPGDGRPRFIRRPRQQRVLYWYFLDPDLGVLHVRVQTWLPFTVQVCVNGHDWLAQQMVHRRLGFVQRHNAFTQLDDPAAAQTLADRFARLNWAAILTRFAERVNPLLRAELARYRPRWVVDQAEFATDLVFATPAALAPLYQALLRYAGLTFTPKDILRFMGRKWDRRFDGTIQTEVRTERPHGTRIKHRMTQNWLKMYDKFGQVLRVETVINRPAEFRVYRTRHHRDGRSSVGWFPMTKGVAGLGDYRDHALACNRRYLDALAVVGDPAPAYRDLRALTEPKRVAGRSSAGFNPARRDDLCLFAAVLDGDAIPRGFRNRDIRARLFPAGGPGRDSAAVGRRLKRLHVRQMVAKVPRTRRWRVTAKGRRVLGAAVLLYRQTWPELTAA